jgi:hypothetical protein
MKKIKSFLSKFKDQSGIGVLSALTIIFIVAVTFTTVTFMYRGAQRSKENMGRFTSDCLPDDKSSEAEKKRRKAFLDITGDAQKMIKTVGPVVNPIPGKKILEKTGALDIPEEYKTKKQIEEETAKKQLEEEKDRKVEEKLNESSLPTGCFIKAIYKSVEDITSENISYDATEEDRDRVTINIVEELINKDPEKIETKDSSEVLDSIRNNLKENKLLEKNEVVIKKRMEYNGALQDKEFLEKEIEAWEYLEEWGIADALEYAGLIEMLDNVNEKISNIESELSLITEGEIEGQKIIEELIEEQETTEEETEEKEKEVGVPYSLSVVASPSDPAPDQGVNVTATISPATAGVEIYFHIIGTDGYENWATYTTDDSGKATFYIPGAEEGVRDKVTVRIVETGEERVFSFVF